MTRPLTPAGAYLDAHCPGWREQIKRDVESAPPLTDSQRTQIALLLRRPPTAPPTHELDEPEPEP